MALQSQFLGRSLEEDECPGVLLNAVLRVLGRPRPVVELLQLGCRRRRFHFPMACTPSSSLYMCPRSV